MEGTDIGGGGDEVSVTPVVNPCGMVSVSSLGYFLSVVSSSKPSHPSLPLSLSLSISHSTPYTRLFKEEEGKETKINQATEGEGQERAEDEVNEVDSPRKVGCWLLGLGTHGIRS